MSPRRPLRLPIILAVAMIVSLVALTVGWILLAVFGYTQDEGRSAFWLTAVVLGSLFLILLLAGTVVYLTLSIKAINLNRRQSNFIDSVTHELKSPIASLKLYLQTLGRRELTDVERNGFYGIMLDDIERLDSLINHLLDAARLEKDTSGDEAVPQIELAAFLTECAKSVCVRHRLDPDIIHLDLHRCVVELRRVDLDMVFRNLIDNAVKYAGSPPDIEVTMAVSGPRRATVRVSDNGRGIPRGKRRKIFRRFVRLGSELERETPGTGLGLFIARTLVRRWKGRISVQDRPRGSGTVFEVDMPISAWIHSDEPLMNQPARANEYSESMASDGR